MHCIMEHRALQRLADAWRTKWDGRWEFQAREGAFHERRHLPIGLHGAQDATAPASASSAPGARLPMAAPASAASATVPEFGGGVARAAQDGDTRSQTTVQGGFRAGLTAPGGTPGWRWRRRAGL